MVRTLPLLLARIAAVSLPGCGDAPGEVCEPGDDDCWLVICSKDAQPGPEAIRAMRDQRAGWGAGLDADIDGWDAAITT